MIEGRYEADLGGLLFKKRIARTGSGKSGGFRTIIGFRKGMSDRIVFLFGFAKSDRETITEAERLVLAALARSFVDCDEAGLSALLASRTYDEVEAIQ